MGIGDRARPPDSGNGDGGAVASPIRQIWAASSPLRSVVRVLWEEVRVCGAAAQAGVAFCSLLNAHWHTGRALKVDFKLRPCVLAFNPAQRRRCVIRGAIGPMTVTVVTPAAELPGRL